MLQDADSHAANLQAASGSLAALQHLPERNAGVLLVPQRCEPCLFFLVLLHRLHKFPLFI